mgnify:CR=1 FL=1
MGKHEDDDLTTLERSILDSFRHPVGGGWSIIDAAGLHPAAVNLTNRGLLEQRHTVQFRLAERAPGAPRRETR